jgi:hypothetical protein
MLPLRDFQQRHQVPVGIVEFIAIAWTNGEEQYLLVLLVGVFQEWNWAWIYFIRRNETTGELDLAFSKYAAKHSVCLGMMRNTNYESFYWKKPDANNKKD